MKLIKYIILAVIVTIVGCDKIPYLQKETTQVQDGFAGIPDVLKKDQKFDITYRLSAGEKAEINEYLTKKKIFSSIENKNVDLISSKVTCVIIVKTDDAILFRKEFTLTDAISKNMKEIKEPVNLWTGQTKELKPGQQLVASIEFNFSYVAANEEKYTQIFISEDQKFHYVSKDDLKKEQTGLARKGFMQHLAVLKELDPFSLRFGFITGAVFVLFLMLAAKVYGAVKSNSTSPGIYLPESQSTFITTRAIFDLIDIEVVQFSDVKVVSRSLVKLREGHVIKLDIAYDVGKGGFPQLEKHLKEHLQTAFKMKLGLTNIADIHLNIKKGKID